MKLLVGLRGRILDWLRSITMFTIDFKRTGINVKCLEKGIQNQAVLCMRFLHVHFEYVYPSLVLFVLKVLVTFPWIKFLLLWTTGALHIVHIERIKFRFSCLPDILYLCLFPRTSKSWLKNKTKPFLPMNKEVSWWYT